MQKVIKQVPSPEYYKLFINLTPKLNDRKREYDELIKKNIKKKKRFVIVVGPCSADRVTSVTQYLKQLKELAETVEDKILIVARVFTAKPRTDGEGFLGLAFHNKEGTPIDFVKGIEKCRRVMRNCLEIGLPIADELLYPELSEYFSDMVSYQFLGARSSLDPSHRNAASGLDIATGIKNSIDGDIAAVVKSVYAVQKKKQFLSCGNFVETAGNPFSHVVLRGYHDGEAFRKNCDTANTAKVVSLYNQYKIANPFIMVDCSHGNSAKIAYNQIDIARAVIVDPNVNGIILESYLEDGTAIDKYGVSKTDECLNFATTAQLIKEIYSKLK